MIDIKKSMIVGVMGFGWLISLIFTYVVLEGLEKVIAVAMTFLVFGWFMELMTNIYRDVLLKKEADTAQAKIGASIEFRNAVLQVLDDYRFGNISAESAANRIDTLHKLKS